LKHSNIQTVSPTEFEIVTPVATFRLQAKHEVAAQDWVTALNRSKAGQPAKEKVANSFVYVFNAAHRRKLTLSSRTL
jgi:hypothetical protein